MLYDGFKDLLTVFRINGNISEEKAQWVQTESRLFYTESTKPALESIYANYLLQQFAWGCVSPQLIQQIAMLHVEYVDNVI